jgi:hypothetical protein
MVLCLALLLNRSPRLEDLTTGPSSGCGWTPAWRAGRPLRCSASRRRWRHWASATRRRRTAPRRPSRARLSPGPAGWTARPHSTSSSASWPTPRRRQDQRPPAGAPRRRAAAPANPPWAARLTSPFPGQGPHDPGHGGLHAEQARHGPSGWEPFAVFAREQEMLDPGTGFPSRRERSGELPAATAPARFRHPARGPPTRSVEPETCRRALAGCWSAAAE